MLQKFSIECPLAPTSLGQMSMGVLAELYEREIFPNIFPIGPIDLSCFNAPQGFAEWLKSCLDKSILKFNRRDPSIKIWHINDSHKRISDKSRLWLAHETNQLTGFEQNILKQHDSILVTSHYAKEVFKNGGIEAEICPNYFDARSILPVKIHKDESYTQWGLIGKFEKRKHTGLITKLWCQKFGGDKNHRLVLSVFNIFLMRDVPVEHHQEHMRRIVESNIGAALPWNVELVPFQNIEEMSQTYQNIDIDLSGISGAEGFGLPAFNNLCLGKKSIVLDAHAHKDFATAENAVLVEPNGMIDIFDEVFFGRNGFNQGEMFTFSESDVLAAMDEVLTREEPNKKAAEELKNKFSVAATVDILLSDF